MLKVEIKKNLILIFLALLYLKHVLIKNSRCCAIRAMGTFMLKDPELPLLHLIRSQFWESKIIPETKTHALITNFSGFTLVPYTSPLNWRMKTSYVDLILCTRKNCHEFHVRNPVDLNKKNRLSCGTTYTDK